MSKPTIPPSVLAQHLAILGKTGRGKTNTAKVCVEQTFDDGIRVCILDPIKSDWWGITSSADGKRAGLPFHILGGPHAHVPLTSNSGKAIAELVGKGRLKHTVIDMADFEPGGQQRFFADFAPKLLKCTRGVLLLVIEEAHEFAPKERVGMGYENMSIHWAKTLATAGRSKGIRLMVLTQRTQALHNAVLSSCDSLIAHGMTAPEDQERVAKWLKANSKNKALNSEINDSLSDLPRGTGWLCSSEARLFERVEFQKARTFDNTATPEDDSELLQVKTAPIDIDALRAILGNAVAEADANDPKRLKERIAELDKQIARLVKEGSPTSSSSLVALSNEYQRGHEEGRLAGYDQGVRAAQKAEAEERDSIRNGLLDAVRLAFSADLAGIPSLPRKDPIRANGASRPVDPPKPASPRRQPTGDGDPTLPKAERALLTVLGQHQDGRTKIQLSILSGYSIKSSSFSNALGGLRSRGLVERGDPIRITDAGLEALGSIEPLPEGESLRRYWLESLPKAERALLEVAITAHPDALPKTEIAEQSGYSVTSSSFSNALGKLRSLQLINRGDPIKAADELFA